MPVAAGFVAVCVLAGARGVSSAVSSSVGGATLAKGAIAATCRSGRPARSDLARLPFHAGTFSSARSTVVASVLKDASSGARDDEEEPNKTNSIQKGH